MIHVITDLATGFVPLAGETAEVAPNAIGGSQYLSAIIGVFLPIIVALVTKYSTSATTKSILLLFLSGVSSVLTELMNDANFDFQQALFGAVMTFVIGVASLFGLWFPTGVDAKAKGVLVKD